MGCQTGNLPQAAVLFDSSYGNTKKLLNPEIEELFGDPYGNRTIYQLKLPFNELRIIGKYPI